MEYKDYYQTLGVARTASSDEIKKAYRKLARKYHPDVSKESDAELRFKDIGEAYEVLKDPEKRSAYDRFGKEWKAGQQGFQPPPDWETNFQFRSGDGLGGNSGFSDFFEALFGSGRGGARGPGARRYTPKGQDHQAAIEISLEDAYQGASRTVTLQEGSGGGSRSLNVKIPKGVTEGQRIRLSGQGGGSRDGQAGDLYLEIAFQPHRWFRVEGKDIFLDLPVTPWEAALGATVTVPTLGGKVDVKIAPGSQSGQKLRLKGRGLPGSGNSTAGDQYVILKIVTPKADTPAAKALYEKMASELAMNPRAGMGV